MKEVKIIYKRRIIKVVAEKTSFLGKIRGLMFKNFKTPSLLFEFKEEKLYSIHSLFVRFNFLAVWLNSDNSVVEFKIVKPFCFHVQPTKKFTKLIEIPFNEDNKRIIAFFVGKGKI
jgi:uncharacterized membrane protein (UPF0127 family)